MRKFRCQNCSKDIKINLQMGTKNRNHCPHCLFSLHVDEKPGDRSSRCYKLMEPIGLTFKKEGYDKYGKEKIGELMLIHECQRCKKISINRIAADDKIDMIVKLLDQTKEDYLLKETLLRQRINALTTKDEEKLKKQLYGKT